MLCSSLLYVISGFEGLLWSIVSMKTLSGVSFSATSQIVLSLSFSMGAGLIVELARDWNTHSLIPSTGYPWGEWVKGVVQNDTQ